MIKKILVVLITMLVSSSVASDHGIYLKVATGIGDPIEKVAESYTNLLKSNGFILDANYEVSTPDIVREDENEKCGMRAWLIVFTSPNFTRMLTENGNKYLIGSFLRLGIYETPNGIDVNIVDPETISRIIFNDIWENDEEEKYFQIVDQAINFKKEFVTALHSIYSDKKTEEAMPPIRDDEDLMESSKDMFMMVGSLTFFNDEDQFPVIYKKETEKGENLIPSMKKEIIANLKKFKPTQEDVEYRFTKSPEILNWKIISEEYSPDSLALLIGITRDRTEGLSLHIAGSSREEDNNKCPGIDHVTAYPIEVLLLQKDGEFIIQTAREMFRMDMYFWDAGMGTFMNHMSMPGILDESLRKAMLADKYTED